MKSEKTHFPRPSCRLCWENHLGTSVSGRAGSSVRRSFRRFKMAATAETSTSGALQRRYFIKSRARTVSIFDAHSRQPRLWLANEKIPPPLLLLLLIPTPSNPSWHPSTGLFRPGRLAEGGILADVTQAKGFPADIITAEILPFIHRGVIMIAEQLWLVPLPGEQQCDKGWARRLEWYHMVCDFRL